MRGFTPDAESGHLHPEGRVPEPPPAVLPAARKREIAEAVERIQGSKPHFWRWQRPGGYDDIGPLTDGRIAAAEEKLGVSLPAAYLALLAVQNGGRPRYDSLSRPPSPVTGEAAVWIEELWGVGPAPPGRCSTVDSMAHLADTWGLPDELFFLAFHGDYGGVALDYRGRKLDPPVVYADLVSEAIVPLAPDFVRFVDGLFIGNRDHAYGFWGVGDDPARLIAALEDTLGAPFQRFDPPDPPRPDRRDVLFFHTQRFGWRSWFHASTAAGSRIEVLANRRPGTDFLEHPWHPECQWFLCADIHPQHRPQLEQALERLPFEVVPLHLPPWEKVGRPI